MPLAVSVFPESVNVSAPALPLTMTWLLVDPEVPLTKTSWGMAAPLAGKPTNDRIRLPGRQVDLHRVGRLERLVAKHRLADVVVDLDVAAGEGHRDAAAAAVRVDRHLRGRQAGDDGDVYRADGDRPPLAVGDRRLERRRGVQLAVGGRPSRK